MKHLSKAERQILLRLGEIEMPRKTAHSHERSFKEEMHLIAISEVAVRHSQSVVSIMQMLV